MAINRAQKAKILEDLKEISKSPCISFVQMSGVDGNQNVEMRSSLRESGVGFKVAKKTLIKLAFSSANISGDMPELPGSIAVAYSEDETAAAREVASVAKRLGVELKIVGGVFMEEYKDEASMNEIANIPSLQTLRGMFVNIINSPIQRCAIALGQIAEKASQ